jgi:lysophospholipase L1-like esterase
MAKPWRRRQWLSRRKERDVNCSGSRSKRVGEDLVKSREIPSLQRSEFQFMMVKLASTSLALRPRLRWMLALVYLVGAGALAVAQANPIPTVYLLGDSTVRNGSGQGADAFWGWGSFLSQHFDTNQVRVVNRAIGGRSSRTFWTEGRWEEVRSQLKAGDFVLMQFGHNDGGNLTGARGRGSLRGNGAETQAITNNAGVVETVHTYGWYLRQYIAGAKAKGATPIVLSQVPRNIWADGKVGRESERYGKWAREAAAQEGVAFIDLNELVAGRYEQLGEATVRELFFKPTDHTHTTRAGAELNAAVVADALRALPGLAFAEFSDRGFIAFNEYRATDGSTSAKVNSQPLQFTFGAAAIQTGGMPVRVTNRYSAELGFGFETPVGLEARRGFISSATPFLFSVKLPEGNYAVTVALGGDSESEVTMKAEARRLMLERVVVPAPETRTRTFVVNVRRPEIAGGERVRLKQREWDTEMITWDDKLTLEFNGTNPSVRSLKITPTNVATIFLTGDSTVCDQPTEPWNSWGQMLPRFFGPGVAVANYAQSGESIKSSLGAKRFEKVFSLMKPNDWLLVQFGHNDMKDKSPDALAVYKSNLKLIVAQTRKRGGTPVLITSMERKSGVARETLAGYPQTVRDVAREDGVALIDLHALSKVLYRALGAELDAAFQDGTHHNNFGSYQLARCVVTGIRANVPELATYLADDVAAFDPAKPDAPQKFQMVASPAADARKPDGN